MRRGFLRAVFRLTSFLQRRPEFTHAEFVEYWWREHTPLAAALPGLRRYSTTRPFTATASHDGVAELYFDSREAFDRVLGPDAETAAMNDVPEFIASTDRYHLRETVHVDDRPGANERTLLADTPVTEQAGFPTAEFVVFDRPDDVSPTAFDDALAADVERSRNDHDVRWFATAEAVDSDRDHDVAFLKRTYAAGRSGSSGGDTTPAARYPRLHGIAEAAVEFAGYERTVVDELP